MFNFIPYRHKQQKLSTLFFIAFIAICILMLPAFIFNRNKAQHIDQTEMQRFNNALEHIKSFYHEEIDDKALIDAAIQGAFNSLDVYSAYLNAPQWESLQNHTSGSFSGVGLVVTMDENYRVIVVSPIDGTPAANAGIQTDDIIIAVDGQLLESTDLNHIVQRIQGKVGTHVSITLLRGEEELTFDLTRDVINISSISHKLLDHHIGYIRIAYFQEDTNDEVQHAIEELSEDNIQGLILDLRSNPGGLLDSTVKVADLFLDSQQLIDNSLIVYTQSRWKEGEFAITATAGELLKNIPIVVLINKGSASGAEIVAASLKEHQRALLIGETSFGKGSVQTIFPINDEAAKLTTSVYFSPKGNIINGTGVAPDLTVTIEGELGDEANVEYQNQNIIEFIAIEKNDESDEDIDWQLQIAQQILTQLTATEA